MTDILLFFLLLIIVILLIIVLITGSVRLVNEYIPPYRSLGFSEPELIRDCGVYHTFSIETDIVDALEPIPYESNNPYTCQDGSLKRVAKYTNVCLLDSGCIGVNGSLYRKNQRQYFYKTCGAKLTPCDTLGIWFLNEYGYCLDFRTRTFTGCSPETTLLYDDDLIRLSAQNACLYETLALSNCQNAPPWLFTLGYLCSETGCLSLAPNGTLTTVPSYEQSNLQLYMVPAR